MNSIKLFSNSEILTLNALGKLKTGELNPKTFKLINAVVWDVVNQLEQTKEFKKLNIKIND
jgi:hypothetical protein